MSLAELAVALAKAGVQERTAAIWRLLAAFSVALQDLMNKEGDPLRESLAGGG